MSLSDLAALGSFASGIAVVISLISLTIQIRQNTRAMMRAEANVTQEQLSNWRLAIAQSAELPDIWNKGLRDDDLNEVEEVRYSMLLQDLTFAIFQIWHRRRLAFLPAENWKRIASSLATILVTKRGAAWWERNRDLAEADYAAEIDAAIRDVRTSGQSVARSRPATFSSNQFTSEGET